VHRVSRAKEDAGLAGGDVRRRVREGDMGGPGGEKAIPW
jgi:hypothetical protein